MEEFLKEQKPEVRNRILVLQAIQEEHEAKYKEFVKKVREIRKEFENSVSPLYERVCQKFI